MVTVHADTRRSIRGKNNLSQYRKPSSICLVILAILSILPFTALGSGGGAAVTIPLSFSFIIQAPALNTYQAFIAGGNGLPVFTESNFSRLMNNDILSSALCLLGCSITLNPGRYNATQGILVNRPSVTITGSLASVINTMNVSFTNQLACPGLRQLFCIIGSTFTMTGLKIEDFARDTIGGVTGEAISIASGSTNGLLQSLTIQNASSNGINFLGTNYIITTSTLTGPTPIPKTSGNHGITIGGSNLRIFLNSISGFNGSDVAGINLGTSATYITITANNLFKNSFGVASIWGKFVKIEANTINNNYAGGILLTTSAFGSASAGPITINDNTIVDNGQESGNDIQCNNVHCSGINIKGTRPAWDGITITSNTIKDTQAIHTQLYDIYIFSTQYTNLTIVGNTVGTTSSGLTIVMTVNALKSWIISENSGFNPQPVRGPLTAGATPFTYSNVDGYKEQIELITIGDMTAFTCRGIANIIQVDAISPILNTLDTCVFTYVAIAPTYDVLPT